MSIEKVRWNFWYIFALIWAVLGVIDLAQAWITGGPRSEADELLYAMVSLLLGYSTEERKEKR